MQIRKNSKAMTNGMAMLGTRMYRISILLFSRGSAEININAFVNWLVVLLEHFNVIEITVKHV